MLKRVILLVGVVSVVAVGGWTYQQNILFHITGEDDLLRQVSGGIQYGLTLLRPPLQTAPDAPVRYSHVNPYGINTFLQNEVEPAKRERAFQMLSEAGITWIRQEFPWEDIEIHGKGDFEDRRHEPYRSAWDKYDQLVGFAEQYDINIMARLSNPPRWTRVATDTIGTFAPPDKLSDYGDFVEAVATRYKGRIAAYQIWNEPNIFPEWGYYPVSAEEYTALLQEGYTRIKAVDPDAIVVMGALAATIELDRQRRYADDGNIISPGGLSDVLFLQQMYDAGAAPYFDVLAMQGYGLWSGPTDRRMQPRVLNFSRPLYIRDVMVRNGDVHKPIWLSEMGWNALPPEVGLPAIYGQVTLEQQARYTAVAYERMQQEWPWLGVGFYWFFKQADERERDSHPQYYFRMVEPDFSPLPVYEAIQTQTRQTPRLYRGWHQAEHWAIDYDGTWNLISDEAAVFGEAFSGQAGDSVTFHVEGRRVDVVAAGMGRLQVAVDDNAPVDITLTEAYAQHNLLADWWAGEHRVTLTVVDGAVRFDGVVVR